MAITDLRRGEKLLHDRSCRQSKERKYMRAAALQIPRTVKEGWRCSRQSRDSAAARGAAQGGPGGQDTM